MPLDPTVVAAVVQHEGDVLLIRRTAPEAALVWQFPAGKIDPGETPLNAAAREALEEAGVTVEPLQVIGERVHPVTGRRVVYVACRWVSGEARAASPREVSAVEWVTVDEMQAWIPGGVYGPVWEYLAGPSRPS
ncbi:NUDIX domain-containing protein [Streptomyces sp. NPDC046465]|uniref:NUDIX domain-containing protein n=1 Tax=Streptomyces sp. NPDC046465 TaxID=3155810 RepID=UPI0034036D2C